MLCNSSRLWKISRRNIGRLRVKFVINRFPKWIVCVHISVGTILAEHNIDRNRVLERFFSDRCNMQLGSVGNSGGLERKTEGADLFTVSRLLRYDRLGVHEHFLRVRHMSAAERLLDRCTRQRDLHVFGRVPRTQVTNENYLLFRHIFYALLADATHPLVPRTAAGYRCQNHREFILHIMETVPTDNIRTGIDHLPLVLQVARKSEIPGVQRELQRGAKNFEGNIHHQHQKRP